MQRMIRLVAALMILVGAEFVRAQSIEISDKPAGGYPEEACVPIEGTWTLYILARPGYLGEMITAEFYVQGLPAGWVAVSTPNPQSYFVLGDPFATQSPYRCDIAFPTCVAPDANGVVLLFAVTVLPTSVVVNRYLTVTVADPPTNPTFTTPVLFGCDVDYTPYPAAGGQFLMNPQDRMCTVAVESSVWGRVKELYRK